MNVDIYLRNGNRHEYILYSPDFVFYDSLPSRIIYNDDYYGWNRHFKFKKLFKPVNHIYKIQPCFYITGVYSIDELVRFDSSLDNTHTLAEFYINYIKDTNDFSKNVSFRGFIKVAYINVKKEKFVSFLLNKCYMMSRALMFSRENVVDRAMSLYLLNSWISIYDVKKAQELGLESVIAMLLKKSIYYIL